MPSFHEMLDEALHGDTIDEADVPRKPVLGPAFTGGGGSSGPSKLLGPAFAKQASQSRKDIDAKDDGAGSKGGDDDFKSSQEIDLFMKGFGKMNHVVVSALRAGKIDRSLAQRWVDAQQAINSVLSTVLSKG